MIKAIFYLAGICILILCSCQKEINPYENIVPATDSIVPVVNDSTTLVKYIDFDTTMLAGLDTVVIAKYSYDNLKRVVQSDHIEYGITGVPERNFKTVLYYNGGDSLPYKKTESTIELPGGSVSSVREGFYTYANGKLITDSISVDNGQYRTAKRYNYSSNLITEIANRYTGSSLYTEVHRIHLTTSNGNTVAQLDTFLSGNIARYSFSYDNKQNAFKANVQPFVQRSSAYYEMETSTEEMIYEKNNPTQITQYLGTELAFQKISYEYKTNGCPSVARIAGAGTGPPTTIPGYYTKRLFFYTKL